MALVIVLALAMIAAPERGQIVALPSDATRLDDAELVARARRGDAWAHEAIYRRHVRLVASVAGRLLREPCEVDDVVQETFLIAYEKLDRLAEPRALRGWLSQIAVSRVHRRFRFRRFTRLWSAGELAAQLEDQAADHATPEQRAELALLDRALATMPVRLRTAWVLRRVLGHELADVATACGRSLATTKRWLADADARIERHVASPGGER